jgi:excisionase family DNA binding protein
MIRLTTANGLIEFEDREATLELLKNQQAVDAQALAKEAALSKAYSVETLAKRLEVGKRAAYDLIRQGLIGYYCCGAKNYRVSERAVRRFEDGLPPQQLAA